MGVLLPSHPRGEKLRGPNQRPYTPSASPAPTCVHPHLPGGPDAPGRGACHRLAGGEKGPRLLGRRADVIREGRVRRRRAGAGPPGSARGQWGLRDAAPPVLLLRGCRRAPRGEVEDREAVRVLRRPGRAGAGPVLRRRPGRPAEGGPERVGARPGSVHAGRGRPSEAGVGSLLVDTPLEPPLPLVAAPVEEPPPRNRSEATREDGLRVGAPAGPVGLRSRPLRRRPRRGVREGEWEPAWVRG